MKMWIALLAMVGLAGTVQAKIIAAPGQTIAATPALFTTVPASGDIRSGTVTVELGLLSENPKWQMHSTVVPVLVRLVSESLVRGAGPTDNLWKHLKPRQRDYKGLTLRLYTADGHALQPLRFYNGKIATESGRLLSRDAGRHVEFWLFGTARIKGDQQLGGRVLPVLSFDQCRLLGNAIIDTQPRQCLLPDGGIMLETEEKPTLGSLKATDFDSCLIHGQSLIYTFPRRCVAAGGRVFTEPPRVYEAPVSATQVLSTTTPVRPVVKGKKSQTAKAVSATAIETRPGLGTYAVSPVTPSATAVVSASVMPPMPLNVSPTPVVLPVSPVAISLPLSTSVVVSAVIPVAVSVTPVMAPVVSPTVSPTAAVSNFDVNLGK